MAYDFILNIRGNLQESLQRLHGGSNALIAKLAAMKQKVAGLNQPFNATGNSIDSLRRKMQELTAQRDLIDTGDLNRIRQMNGEIRKLSGEISKLENLNGGKFKKWLHDGFNAIPNAGLIVNPFTALAAGIGFAGKAAIDFETNMAKVNATAQLDPTGLAQLSNQIKDIAQRTKSDLAGAPVAFEKILSQTNDVGLSLQILEASAKGAKAGFAEIDTVAGAVSQTLSIVGKENTNAAQVMDTLFAAKRLGAGEFKDFAQYLPNLVAAGKAVNFTFQETAGLFAYMTGKGFDAAKSATLVENAFSALAKTDVQEKLAKGGIAVYDEKGMARGAQAIFTDLNKRLSQFTTDAQKSSFLEAIGLTDAQARAAFMALSSDIGKLEEAMKGTANPTGEMQNALNKTAHTGRDLQEIFYQLQTIALRIGKIALPFVAAGADILSVALSGVSFVTENLIGDGQALTTMLKGAAIGATAGAAAYGVYWAATGGISTALKAAQAAQWALNLAMSLNPVGLLIAGFAALGAGVAWAYNEFAEFRGIIWGVWEALKALYDKAVLTAKTVGSVFKGDFTAAMDFEKQSGKIDVAGAFNKAYDAEVKAEVKPVADTQAAPRPATDNKNLLQDLVKGLQPTNENMGGSLDKLKLDKQMKPAGGAVGTEAGTTGVMNNMTLCGGAGGSAGGIVVIRANNIVGSGSITARGGRGQNSIMGSSSVITQSPAPSIYDAGVGGGGGDGGILILTNNIASTITLDVSGGQGGIGSSPATGFGNGQPGQPGTIFIVKP